MLLEVFNLIKNTGLKNTSKKMTLFLYRKSGLRRYFIRRYSYHHNLESKFGNLKWDLERIPYLKLPHIKKLPEYLSSLPIDVREKIKARGREIVNRKYTLFSFHKIYQKEVNFRVNPFDKMEWPEKKDSSVFSQFDPKWGDIKRVWELNRFVFAGPLVSAYHLESEAGSQLQIRDEFLYLLKSWLSQNPHERTVAWACSQEISIRCINLIFIFRYLGCDEDGEIGSLFKNMLALSAHHVFNEIEYAKAQRNNHAITESAFLIFFSSIFPLSKWSTAYYKKGVETLSFCMKDQFFADGTYIQNSFTYQRFALQNIILVEALITEAAVTEEINQIFKQSLIFLYNITFGSDGDFPNYGPNDGALLFDWSGGEYRDMRLLLNLLSLKTKGIPVFMKPESLIDAAIMLEGVTSKFNEVYTPPQRKRFDQSGYYIMRNEIFSVLFRCGSYVHRYPSQNDMLHVDVWINGKSVFSDSGTYEYFGISGIKEFHYFLSTAAHNTVKIGNRDQLDKGPRFTWFSTIHAKLTDWSINRISGESHAYQGRLRGNPIHTRTLEFLANQFVIIDEITDVQKYPVELFWHTTESENITLVDKNSFDLVEQKINISFESLASIRVETMDTPISRYYAEKKQRKTLVLTSEGQNQPISIKTTIRVI